ncbi:MAG: phosphorylase [Cyanobacteria bacterium]|nr:phosphorylase [Cyanobacteriota bacterium]MDA0867657.1 phosphorylase [Cyanobacteriota bacterium]
MTAPADLTPGTLWEQLQHRTATALACGALQPIPTEFTVLEDGGIHFLVRIVKNLVRKETATAQQRQAAKQGKPANPFLPYEDALFVGNLSPTHLCLLNKFNVVDHHLLVVTRAYESQEDWLTLADFTALAMTLKEIDGLGFYNGGRAAGASQHHKHLQVVPFPFHPDKATVPIAALIHPRSSTTAGMAPLPLPFHHGVLTLDLDWSQDAAAIAPILWESYRQLATHIGVDLKAERPNLPYNLLATRQWMLVVPRSREDYQGIPVNSLGYAGSLLVKTAAGLAHLKQIGPLNLLAAVGQPMA